MTRRPTFTILHVGVGLHYTSPNSKRNTESGLQRTLHSSISLSDWSSDMLQSVSTRHDHSAVGHDTPAVR